MTDDKASWDRGTILLLAHVVVIVGVLAYLLNR